MAFNTPFFDDKKFGWYQRQDVPNRKFVCGYCTTTVSSVKGYRIGQHPDGSGVAVGGVYICPNCRGPVFVNIDGTAYPSPAFGNKVRHVPAGLETLYEEARRCTSASSYTGAVLLCRKMLMNIAVEEGADEGLKFIEYVNFLSDKGFVPPNGKHWVDHIRKRGNEATHEITVMSEDDAKELLGFVEMLLRFIYEFPNLIPSSPGASP